MNRLNHTHYFSRLFQMAMIYSKLTSDPQFVIPNDKINAYYKCAKYTELTVYTKITRVNKL